MSDDTELLRETQVFWDSNPCDGQTSYDNRCKFRYGKDPWLLSVLQELPAYTDILEVGCGQGTDALTICSHKTSGRYTGLDLSAESVASAQKAATELSEKGRLLTMPLFMQGNAEKLPFEDNSFDCILSVGVLTSYP